MTVACETRNRESITDAIDAACTPKMSIGHNRRGCRYSSDYGMTKAWKGCSLPAGL